MHDYNSDYLQHHGVKGMKWGVQRYQKKDGSLTEAGMKRVRESGGYMDPQHKGKYVSSKNKHVREKDKVYYEFIDETKRLGGRYISNDDKIALSKKYIDKYSDAVLSDLKLKNTERAKNYVKRHLMYDEHGKLTNVGKDIEEFNRRETIKNMSNKERQKVIDKVNAKYQKKLDELNKQLSNPNADKSRLELEMDVLDAEWLDELDKYN